MINILSFPFQLKSVFSPVYDLRRGGYIDFRILSQNDIDGMFMVLLFNVNKLYSL